MEGKMIRQASAIGLAAMMTAACGSEAPRPRDVQSYNYRIALEAIEGRIVCYTDDFPFKDDLPWTLVIDEGYCPEGTDVKIVKNLKVDFTGLNIQVINQSDFKSKGEVIPPIEFTQ